MLGGRLAIGGVVCNGREGWWEEAAEEEEEEEQAVQSRISTGALSANRNIGVICSSPNLDAPAHIEQARSLFCQDPLAPSRSLVPLPFDSSRMYPHQPTKPAISDL